MMEHKIKVGDLVRTTKGDRLNPDAKTEVLEVIKRSSPRCDEVRYTCLKPNGRLSSFLAKNLVPHRESRIKA